MKNRANVLLIILLFAFSSLSFVLAAGSSTGNSQNSPQDICESAGGTWSWSPDGCSVKTCANPTRLPGCTAPAVPVRSCDCGENKCWNGASCELATANNPSQVSCETPNTLRERIKCRFQNKAVARAESSIVIEEACRGQARAEECKQLYRQSKECYEIESAREKKRCFLEKSGVNINAGGTFRAAPDDTKRNYVVLLLYELQERIEEMEETGTLTSDEATDLVTQIVEIKKLILEGKPRSEIVPKIQQFKQDYRTATGAQQPTDYSCSSNSDCELRVFNYCCGAALEGINRCYNKNEPEQQALICTSGNPCPGFQGPPITSCGCVNSVCAGVNN